jgi:hypothetical protein
VAGSEISRAERVRCDNRRNTQRCQPSTIRLSFPTPRPATLAPDRACRSGSFSGFPHRHSYLISIGTPLHQAFQSWRRGRTLFTRSPSLPRMHRPRRNLLPREQVRSRVIGSGSAQSAHAPSTASVTRLKLGRRWSLLPRAAVAHRFLVALTTKSTASPPRIWSRLGVAPVEDRTAGAVPLRELCR